MKDLSILIPARNEMFVARTVEDVLANIEADTEIIVVLDGAWADPPIKQHERVNVIFVPESIGQRAATNLACRLSKAKYVMKCDAHCAFDKGFDRKMIEAFAKAGDDVTMVPVMRNLWAFDWKCLKCGKKWYQGPTPTKCREENYKGTGIPCDSTTFERKIIWKGKSNPQSTSYCFDSTPHFQYFEDWKHRDQYLKDKEQTGLTETMSLQGSCWMLTREKYWELEISDENFGSWGSQGIEVAAKTWLSGGRVLVNHHTWYAHMFRTQGGDFSFPYPISNKDQEHAKQYARELFFNGQWAKQVHPLSWLIEKFWPVRGWTDEDLAKLKNNQFEFKGEAAALPNTTEIEPTESQINQNTTESSEALTSGVNSLASPELISPETGSEFNADLPSLAKESPSYESEKKGVAIIGHGWVGKSVEKLFPKAYIYNPPKSSSKRKVNKCEVAFICVPTPAIDEGKLDISIVEECVAWCESSLIVIRSTVNPGTADYLSQKYNKRVVVQPGYLGETAQHPLFEEKNSSFMVLGGDVKDRRRLIELYTGVYNANIKIRQVTALEAEVIKLTENRAIAFKVGQCQELYDVCEKAGADYYTVRDAVYGDDPRFTLWWTFIFPEQRGFKSKCIPKDVYAWCAWAESLGMEPELTRSLLEVNKRWISGSEK